MTARICLSAVGPSWLNFNMIRKDRAPIQRDPAQWTRTHAHPDFRPLRAGIDRDFSRAVRLISYSGVSALLALGRVSLEVLCVRAADQAGQGVHVRTSRLLWRAARVEQQQQRSAEHHRAASDAEGDRQVIVAVLSIL